MKPIEIIERLQAEGFDAFIAGGAVRDLFLGLEPKDQDVVTDATPDMVEDLFGDSGAKSVGKAFGVVLIEGTEVATFRTDKCFGLGHKDTEVAFARTFVEDASRRDFTINAMAWDPLTGVILDPFDGIKDIATRTIRFVGNPDHRIWEDPNRILRACRMVALLEGSFDPPTLDALCGNVNRLSHVARERIKEEILKAMRLRRPSLFFRALMEIGALKTVLPSLASLAGLEGGPHHDEDVFTHSLLAGDSVTPKCPLLRLAAFLHDVGKVPTAVEGTFYDHEKAGVDIVIRDLSALRFSNSQVKEIASLVRLHGRFWPHNLTPRGIRRTILKCREAGIRWHEDLLRIRLADCKANLKRNGLTLMEIRELVGLFREQEQVINGLGDGSRIKLAVDGTDVIRTLGIKPGPEVGKRLKELTDAVIGDPGLNNKEKLLAMLAA